MVSAAIYIRVIHQNRLTHDPPRSDFAEETALAPPSFNVSALGDSPFAPLFGGLVRPADELARLFDGLVVAIERASGAELAEDAPAAAARIDEALAFAARASRVLIESSLTASLRSTAVEREMKTLDLDQSTRDSVTQFAKSLEALSRADSKFGHTIGLALDGGTFLSRRHGQITDA